MTHTKDDAVKVAKAFADVLKEWLTPMEFEQMRRDNRKNKDPRLCASHDYCDANMAMFEAMRKCGRITLTADELGTQDRYEREASLENEAWDLAYREHLS